MLKRYEIILWDVDGTLLNFDMSQDYALKKAFEEQGIGIDDEIVKVYSEINESYWKRLEKGEIGKDEVRIGRFATLFEQFGDDGLLKDKEIDRERIGRLVPAEFTNVYQKYLGSVYFYQDDSLTLCKKLKEQGFRQYIITNGVTWTQKNKLTLAGFYEVMDAVFISEEIGFHKPDVRFFDAVFERISRDIAEDLSDAEFVKSRYVIVGDSQTSDMQGARNVGVDCCLYRPAADVAEDAVPCVSGNGTVRNANNEAADHVRQNADGNARGNMEVTWKIKNLWEVEAILWQNQRTND